MKTTLPPVISKFETDEQADRYDRWFREQVQASLNTTKPLLPHDQAMARVESQLIERRVARATRSL